VKKYILAVPNFSEGRDNIIIEKILSPFRNNKDVKLIDYNPDPDFNRTCFDAIGEVNAMFEALIDMTRIAMENINMEHQTGAHPRIGAQDTIPIFPLKNIALEECKEFIEKLGKEIYSQLKLPVYFSGENARISERKNLAFIRKGQYEGLKKVVHTPERAPDIGPAELHHTAGAIILSASVRPLVAYNVFLDTDDVSIAKSIAKSVRGPSGGFSTVRAIGLIFEKKQVAVSMNMLDYKLTPLYRTFELIRREANRYGVKVTGSEIVGTLQQEALILVAEYFLGLRGFDRALIIENHLQNL